jgi:hypothetical protein
MAQKPLVFGLGRIYDLAKILQPTLCRKAALGLVVCSIAANYSTTLQNTVLARTVECAALLSYLSSS